MTPESKNVKLAAIAALLVGVVLTAVSAFFAITTDDKLAWGAAAVAGVVLLVLGFAAARLINVPSNASKVRARSLGCLVCEVALCACVTFVLKAAALTIAIVAVAVILCLVLCALSHSASKAYEKK